MKDKPCFGRLECVLLCAIICASFAVTVDADASHPGTRTSLSTTSTAIPEQPNEVGPNGGAQNNTTGGVNSTNVTDGYGKRFMDSVTENRGMLTRTLYVLIGITAIIVVYFGIRTLR